MEPQILAAGAILGDRFEIVEPVDDSGFGHLYLARDTERGNQVALRVLPHGLLRDDALEFLRERVRQAASLQFRNIQALHGMGRHTDGSTFVAAEWVPGQNLRVLLNRRAETGKRFSFKGAYNVLGHVCNALSYAHATMCHGALAPRAILINDAGRVKVGDFGISLLWVRSQEYAAKNIFEPLFWAPEALKSEPQTVTASADIYSLGAIFYELITGMPPKRPLKAPSVLGFSEDVDGFIAGCMADDPRKRFKDAAAAKTALLKLVEAHKNEDKSAKAEDDDLAIDVEIELSSRPAPPNTDRPVSRSAAKPKEAPGIGAPPPPLLPSPPALDFSASLDAPKRSSFIDMGAVLGNLGKSETAHWMVQKGKFDYGPFTDRELVQMISMGEVLGQHNLLDMDNGVRKTVRAWNHFETYLEEYRIRKQKQDEALALERTQKAETRSTAFKVVIALGIVGLIVVVVGGFLLSRKLREDSNKAPEDVLAALEAGEIKLKTGGLDSGAEQGKRRHGGGKHGSGGGDDFVPGMSYEDAMAKGVNLGNLAGGSAGGGGVLSEADINRVMDRNVRSFLPCVAGGSVKRVDVNLAIDGSGRVIGASVKQGDGSLQRCVEAKIRAIRFPSSSQPRTATSWFFELY